MKKIILLFIFVTVSISYSSDKTKILPAELTYFRVEEKFDHYTAEWETASEVNTKEFILQSKVQGENEWTDLGSVEAAGISNTKKEYSFDEISIVPFENIQYRLKLVDLDGEESYSIEITKYFNDITKIKTFNGSSSQDGIVLEWQSEYERQLGSIMLVRESEHLADTITTHTAQTFSEVPTDYSFTDEFVKTATDYKYYLYGIPVNGKDTTVLLAQIETQYSPSNISEIGLSNEISIYPNPASDFINVEMKIPGRMIEKISIIDLNGRSLIPESEIIEHNRLNINHLSPGAYLVEVKFTNGRKFRKLIFKN